MKVNLHTTNSNTSRKNLRQLECKKIKSHSYKSHRECHRNSFYLPAWTYVRTSLKQTVRSCFKQTRAFMCKLSSAPRSQNALPHTNRCSHNAAVQQHHNNIETGTHLFSPVLDASSWSRATTSSALSVFVSVTLAVCPSTLTKLETRDKRLQ